MFIIYLIIWFIIAGAAIGVALEDSAKSFVIALLISLILLAPGFLSIPIQTGRDGEHNGFVTAVEQSGIFWKNYRVYVKTDNQSSQEDVYCLPEDNPDLAQKLRGYSRTRQRVSIQYFSRQYIFQSYSNCAGDIITGAMEEK